MGRSTFDIDGPFAHVVRWRTSALHIRLAQAGLIAVLSCMAIGPLKALGWMAAATVSITTDFTLSKRLLRRPDDPLALTAVLVSLPASGFVYAAIGVLLLTGPDPTALAQTALVLCAVNLNNAVMTRSSRLASLLILGPSSLVLLAAPLFARLIGRPLSLAETLLFEAGVITYLVFIARMAAALEAESRSARRALEDQARERRRAEFAMEEAVQTRARWRMVFDLSPLPQSCFDASRLYAALKPHIEAREPNLGELARVFLEANPDPNNWFVFGETNEAAEILFQVTDLGGHLGQAQMIHDSFKEGFLIGLNGMDEDGVLAPFDAKIVRPNGELIDIRAHVRMPPGQDPPWSGCIASYIDMTAARAASDAQQAAVEAAEAANRAKTDFLAVMSHEIRTPLNGVLGMAQAMTLEPLSAVQRDRLGVIRQSGEALLELLNDLLDLSKIEAGKLELESAEFDLDAVVRGVQAAFATAAAAKGLALEVTVDRSARRAFRGDAARVRQVISNLVANAVKFTESGQVRLRVKASDQGVRISVRDTGVGIAPERIPRLFQKFVQADSSTTRRFGGTGLGLAICRQLCEAMGGTIAVESAPGEGSAFTVDLPLAPSGAAAAPRRPARKTAGRKIAPLRVLAAEDNPVNQLVLKTLLAQVGIAPTIAANGEEAVAAFAPGAWDLILMDVQMPVMDGPAAARAIRAREAAADAPRTPIIALTANAMSHQLEAYREAGMDGVLAKPIEVAQLYAALDAAAPRPKPRRRKAA